MHGYLDDIETATSDNTDFRRVLYTGEFLQLVLMAIAPGEDIGAETHTDHDQFFRIEKGHGIFVIDGDERSIKDGDGIVVPAGAQHNIINTGKKTLRLYTLYGPPNHRDGVHYATKSLAQTAHEHFDGATTEDALNITKK